MLSSEMTATKKPRKPKKSEGRPMSVLTEAGEKGRIAAVRKLLLETLKANNWNLTATAEALGTKRPGIIRALNEAAPDEYARAKADGRVSPGNRRE